MELKSLTHTLQEFSRFALQRFQIKDLLEIMYSRQSGKFFLNRRPRHVEFFHPV